MKRQSLTQATRRIIIFHWAPLLTWMAAIFTLSSLTPVTIERTAESLGFAVPQLINEVTVHSVEFGVLAVRTDCWRPTEWWPPLTCGLPSWPSPSGTARLTSTTSLSVPSWRDVGYDSLGALIGLLVAELTALLRRRFDRAGRS